MNIEQACTADGDRYITLKDAESAAEQWVEKLKDRYVVQPIQQPEGDWVLALYHWSGGPGRTIIAGVIRGGKPDTRLA